MIAPLPWMVRQLRRISVRRRLMVTFAVVSIVPLFATTWIVANLATRSTEETIQTQSAGTIAQVADSLSTQLSALERAAVRLSYQEPFQQLASGVVEPETLSAAQAGVREEFYLTNYVVAVQVTHDGTRWTDVTGTGEGTLLDVAPEMYPTAVERIADQGGRSVYLGFRAAYDSSSDRRSLGYVQQWRRIFDSDSKQAIGYLVVTVQESYLSQVVSQVNEIPGSRAVVASDADYRVISNVGSGLLRVGDELDSDVRLSSDSPAGTTVVLEGTNYHAATAEVTNTDLFAVLLIPTEYLFASRNAALRAFFAVAAAAAVAALLVSAVISRTVNQPIDRMMRKISQLGQAPGIELRDDDAADELAQLDREFNHLMVLNREHMQQKENDLQERHRMELKVLQAQLNPHFLANALGSMRQLARIGNTGAVVELSEALTGVVNHSFRTHGDWTTLGEELNAVRDYAVIASYRHMGRITLCVDVQPELHTCVVPQFLLQPVVENAYAHAFPGDSMHGMITVSASRVADFIRIEITDNGTGISELADISDPSERTARALELSRFGLRAVQERLTLMYNEQASFEISSEPYIFTTVRVTLPYEEA